MEKNRISLKEEISNIEANIKILRGIYHAFMKELENATEKAQKETIKYNILTVSYVLSKENNRKQNYQKFLERANNMYVISSNRALKEEIKKYTDLLKIYKRNEKSIETIINHGNIDMLKKQHNLEDEDIEFIKYLIDNYKNVHIDSKRVK